MNVVVTVNVTKDAASGILSAAVTMPEDTGIQQLLWFHPVVTKFDFHQEHWLVKLAAWYESSFALKASNW